MEKIERIRIAAFWVLFGLATLFYYFTLIRGNLNSLIEGRF